MNLGWAVAPLVIGAVLYLIQSANYFFGLNRIGLAIAFVGYVIGNLGLVYDIFEQWGKQ